MTGMKYIVYDDSGIETPILFPPTIEHYGMAIKMNCINEKLLSAGFVQLSDGKVVVSGRSNSLHIQHRPEDAEIIKRWLTWEL